MLRVPAALFAIVFLMWSAAPASAQSLGTFRWQLTPYCNVVTVQVTQIGSQYRLEGFDNECGLTGRSAPVTGLAVPSPNGTLGFGFAVITADGPVHLNVDFNINSLGGTWRDSSGNTGVLVFFPAGTAGGSPRPAPSTPIADGAITGTKIAAGAIDGSKILDGSVGAADINGNEVQRRVSGVCATGQTVQSINADGTVNCLVVGGGVGTITGVTAGAGLTGGGTAGPVALAVNFAGSGAAATSARSDHTHVVGATTSVAVGPAALGNITVGESTAIGVGALATADVGISNTAVGYGALTNAAGALSFGNTSVGRGALGSLTAGGFNIAIGTDAGFNLTAGDNNIYIDHPGPTNESGVIRIGETSVHNHTFLAGVFGASVSPGSLAVVVDAEGKLGTVPTFGLAQTDSGSADVQALKATLAEQAARLDAQDREIAELRALIERFVQKQ